MHAHHFQDEHGNPAGGQTFGNGYCIAWQHGPLQRGGARQDPNGAFVEEVIIAAIDRLNYYQRSKFECEENDEAIHHLVAAVEALHRRTEAREARQVEGTHHV